VNKLKTYLEQPNHQNSNVSGIAIISSMLVWLFQTIPYDQLIHSDSCGPCSVCVNYV